MSIALRNRWIVWKDLAGQAVLSLADHRLRVLLSVLGIAIGIAAVILIGVVSQGGSRIVLSELETFGLRTIWVFRDQRVTDPRRAVREGSGIDNTDLAAVRESNCCPGLQHLDPVILPRGQLSPFARAQGRHAQVDVEGVGLNYLRVNNDELQLGRAFGAQDIEQGRRVAIIGTEVQKSLFPDRTNPLGQEIRIGDARLTVIGVLRAKDRSFLASIGSVGGRDANARVLLPWRRVQSMLQRDQINLLQAELAPGAGLAAIAQLQDFLHRRHKGAFDYRSENMMRHMSTAGNILGAVSTIGVVAASVSLFVAGLGILNIMSTSVLERTREIGLRKAVGATGRDILLQFLLESMLISLLGGVIGLLLGGLASLALTTLLKFPLLPSVPLIITALVVSLVVGILSGIYPAWRAARLHPVEALRYE